MICNTRRHTTLLPIRSSYSNLLPHLLLFYYLLLLLHVYTIFAYSNSNEGKCKCDYVRVYITNARETDHRMDKKAILASIYLHNKIYEA